MIHAWGQQGMYPKANLHVIPGSKVYGVSPLGLKIPVWSPRNFFLKNNPFFVE